jgi:phosphatidylglycerophosphate synthase
MFMTHKFNFKSYIPTMVFVVVSKDTPLWYMVAFVITLSVVGSLANWGVGSGGVARAAVFWGVGMFFFTFTVYRVLWAMSEVGTNVKKWNNVWKLTRTKGNVHRAADQKISFAIVVISAVLTTWLAVQGVYG